MNKQDTFNYGSVVVMLVVLAFVFFITYMGWV